MNETSAFAERRINQLLVGDEQDIALAIELIDRNFRIPISASIRRYCPGMTPEDLADTWQETLEGIYKAAIEARFAPDERIVPLLLKIARRRAVDRIRRKTSDDRVITAVGKALEATHVRQQWKECTKPERKEIMALIRHAISKLPPKQRVVFQAFVDNYPESKTLKVLAEEVSNATSEPVTDKSVARALDEGRKKVCDFLRKKGYDLLP